MQHISYARRVAIMAYAREGISELARIAEHPEVGQDLRYASARLEGALVKANRYGALLDAGFRHPDDHMGAAREE